MKEGRVGFQIQLDEIQIHEYCIGVSKNYCKEKMSTNRLDTAPHLLVKLRDELGSFGGQLRLTADHVVGCDCWSSETAKRMVYPETARIPLRGRQQVRQELRVRVVGVRHFHGRRH